jgi:hypothetical protein
MADDNPLGPRFSFPTHTNEHLLQLLVQAL